MKEFKGKTAIITGAAYGFGREFVKQAAIRGMKIVAVDIMGEELAKLEAIAKENGAEDITLITADVGIYEETEKVVKTALEKYGTIDLLMNNAGVAVPGNGYNLPLRDWEWIVQTNFMSHVYFMRQVIPIMLKQGTHCNIMNTCSVAGVINWTGMVPYYSTKMRRMEIAEKGGQERKQYVIETGLPIEGHAEQVWAAIEEDRFYVLPHEKYDGFLKLQTAEKLQRKSPNYKEGSAAEGR